MIRVVLDFDLDVADVFVDWKYGRVFRFEGVSDEADPRVAAFVLGIQLCKPEETDVSYGHDLGPRWPKRPDPIPDEFGFYQDELGDITNGKVVLMCGTRESWAKQMWPKEKFEAACKARNERLAQETLRAGK